MLLGLLFCDATCLLNFTLGMTGRRRPDAAAIIYELDPIGETG